MWNRWAYILMEIWDLLGRRFPWPAVPSHPRKSLISEGTPKDAKRKQSRPSISGTEILGRNDRTSSAHRLAMAGMLWLRRCSSQLAVPRVFPAPRASLSSFAIV